jgi:hypothetical protein
MNVPSNATFEAKFTAHSATWTLDPDVPLDSMKLRDTVQVRSLSDIAPADQVNLYAIQMNAGEVFPPVVLWGDVIIDGNTRIHAARKAGIASLPAYRISCRNESHARQIAASLNQTNGRRLNPAESRHSAVSMMTDGYSDAFVARELGVEASKVRRWRKDEDGREHAERLGLGEQYAELAATTRAKVADISHDAPFRALVEALTAYDVPTSDLNELLNDIKKAPTDDDAVRMIEERCEDLPPSGTRRSGRGPRVTAKEANRSIGALIKHDVSYWVDLTVAEDVRPKWEALAELAASVLAEYHRLNEHAA